MLGFLILRKKCPYSELFWSAFSSIWTGISSYSVRMRENEDQNNSEYGHISRSVHIRALTVDRERVNCSNGGTQSLHQFSIQLGHDKIMAPRHLFLPHGPKCGLKAELWTWK